jgi:hypothetical protein
MLVPDDAFVNRVPSALRHVSIGPRVKFAPIKRNALLPDWDLKEMWPYLNVESIPIHAHITWSIS